MPYRRHAVGGEVRLEENSNALAPPSGPASDGREETPP